MNSIVLGVAATLVIATAARADSFHVATNGSDAATGTRAAPWRTIQRAANQVIAGDTVTIHAGSYLGFRVEARGTAAAPIAFIADGEVAIDGAATADRDAIHVENAAWVRIEGFTVTGATRAGISALDCEHITIHGNRVDQSGKWGVFTAFCDDLVIEHNETSRSREQHGIYVSNSADRPVIRHNRIWGNAMCGIHLNGDVSFGGDGVISDAIIEGNLIHDNGRTGGSAINGDGIVDATIRNNVLDGNHASGVSLYRIDGGAPSTGNQVINNTVRMASDARWAINIQDGSTHNVLRNNVLLHRSASRGAIAVCAGCTTGMVSDHNAVVGRFLIDGAVVDLAGWRARTGGDAASFVATEAELFVDPVVGLTLRAGSPAIDHGGPGGAPARDVMGTARPQGAAIDVGAYERCEAGCAGDDSVGDGGADGEGEGAGGEDEGDGAGDDAATAPDLGGCATGAPSPSVLAWVGLVLAFGRRRRRGSRAR